MEMLESIPTFQNMPTGWTLGGSHPQEYDFGEDDATSSLPGTTDSGFTELLASCLRSVAPVTHGYGTMMRTVRASAYRGNQLKLTGILKVQNLNGFAGLWLRISGMSESFTRFDNMEKRNSDIEDWKKCECVCVIPEECTEISFGALLHGSGQLWIANVGFEIV